MDNEEEADANLQNYIAEQDQALPFEKVVLIDNSRGIHLELSSRSHDCWQLSDLALQLKDKFFAAKTETNGRGYTG